MGQLSRCRISVVPGVQSRHCLDSVAVGRRQSAKSKRVSIRPRSTTDRFTYLGIYLADQRKLRCVAAKRLLLQSQGTQYEILQRRGRRHHW